MVLRSNCALSIRIVRLCLLKADEEDAHRRQLISLHETRFGVFTPLIRREYIAGFYACQPIWLMATIWEAKKLAPKQKRWSVRPKIAGRFSGQRSPSQSARRRSVAKFNLLRGRSKRRVSSQTKVHTDLGTARLGGLNGRICFDACANFCYGLCHPELAYYVFGRVGGCVGRRGFNGFYRSRLR